MRVPDFWRHVMLARPFGLTLLVAAGLGSAGPMALAQDPAAFYRQNCLSCHTIGGGRLVGPDLKDVTDRQDKAWLGRFILNPQAVISSGDAYARKILSDAGGVVMPAVPGLSEAMARSLIDLIEAESKLESSQFKGVQVSDRPFLPADVEHGLDLFNGRAPLENKGPACLSCHTLASASSLGGGVLGPDLTKAYERLGGRAGLTNWLSAPATPLMQAVFAKTPLEPDEIEALVACLESGARQSPAVGTQEGRLGFMSVGTALAVAGLVLLNRIWRGRLRGVRSSLVQASSCQTQGDR